METGITNHVFGTERPINKLNRRNISMVSEETLTMIHGAFGRLSQRMNGWRLDDGWYYQDQTTDDLTVHLIRGHSERRSIIVAPGMVLVREGEITGEGLEREILNRLTEAGMAQRPDTATV
jgi:hypothetical protein